MAVQLFGDKQAMVESFKDFLSELTSDTQSVQVAIFAYTDSYDNYDDKRTKCVKEGDIWWNLSPEDQMELLSDAVSTTLKKVAEYESLAVETEDDVALKEEAKNEIHTSFKRLARSFALNLGAEAENNIETAASAEEQMERLFEGVIAFDNRQLYQLLIATFQKKKALADVIDNLTWKIMSQKKAAPKKAVGKPIGKPNIPSQPQKPVHTPETAASPADSAKSNAIPLKGTDKTNPVK